MVCCVLRKVRWPPDGQHLNLTTMKQVGVCTAADAAATLERRGSGAGAASPVPRSPAALLTPATPPPPPATPAQLQAARPLDLWALAGGGGGDDTGASAFIVPTSIAAADTAPSPSNGRFFAVAVVWPAARVAKGLAAASPALFASLGRPAPGSQLGVWRCERPAGGDGGGAVCAEAWLRVCAAAGSSGSSGGDADNGGALPAVDSEARRQQQGTQQGAAAAAAGPAASPATPRRPPSSGGKGAGGKGGGPAAAASSAAAAAAAAAADEWRARLLASGLEWGSERVRALVGRLAARQLAGRWLLPGALAPLPLLGVSLVAVVEAAAPAPAADGGAAGGAAGGALLATEATRVHVLMPDDDPPAAAAAAADAAAAGSGKQDGGAGGSSSGPPSAKELEARLAAARAAAKAAVRGSGADAAVAAAERAVIAGWAAAADPANGASSSGSGSGSNSGSGGYAGLGGVSRYRAALRDLVTLPLRSPELFARYRIRPPRGVLLHGPPGGGKTALARAAAADARAALLVVSGPDVMAEHVGESEAGLTGVFAAARALAPAVILLDEVDALAPARSGGGAGGAHGASAHAAAAGGGGGGGDGASRVLTTLLTLMDGVAATPPDPQSQPQQQQSQQPQPQLPPGHDRVVVIGATNRADALDPALRRPGRLERELEVGAPSPAERREILEARLARVAHALTSDQVAELAAGAHGFVGADLAALVNEAALCALRRVVGSGGGGGSGSGGSGNGSSGKEGGDSRELKVLWDDFAAAQARVRPSALREVAVEVPKVSWADVGGLEGVKQRLKEAVEWPRRHAAALARLGAAPPRGVLLYGPPGCSKTLLARAVASEAGLNFLSVKGGELHSKWVGGGERAVAALFARARAAAPAVVFFDELDGLVGGRAMDGGGGGSGGSGPGERVLAQLLMELDGLQPRLGVVVLAATNRPDRIDAALLRPGRFDRLLRVPPPDAAARAEVFAVCLRRTPLAGDVDLAALAARTEGFTGADVAAACREAALAALDESLEARDVAARHFDAALARVAPSAAPGAALEAVYRDFERAGRLEAL